MKNNKPVWTFEEPTTLTLAEIASVLYEVIEGNSSANNLPFVLRGKSACKVHKEGSRFLIHFQDGHKEYITIDKANHMLSITRPMMVQRCLFFSSARRANNRQVAGFQRRQKLSLGRIAHDITRKINP